MPQGDRLEKAMRRAIAFIKGSEEEVYLRVYSVEGGHAESGTPPVKTPVDTPIVPRPAVSDAQPSGGRFGERAFAGVTILDGDKRLVTSADAPIETGANLYFGGSDWRVVAVTAPAFFGRRILKAALARKVQE